jgi:hypothetical protein
MNREEIIRMAREAGYKHPDAVGEAEDFAYFDFERFAALVAAAVEERLKWDGLHSCHSECDRPACVHTRKAVEVEREACAKLCEDIDAEYEGEDVLATWCAAAIRARGQ